MAGLRTIVAGTLCLALLAGCGGGSSEHRPDSSGRGAASRAPPAAAGNADPAATRVIRGWADSLRAGNIKRAASYFAIPSVVDNVQIGGRIRTPAQAALFNVSLPCGARLVSARRAGRYTAATFVLTERPGRLGGHCTGVGGKARTAFVIRGGTIQVWRRLPDPGAPAPRVPQQVPPGGQPAPESVPNQAQAA